MPGSAERFSDAGPSSDTGPLSDKGDRIAVGFSRALRDAGLSVPLSATLNFSHALEKVGSETRNGPYWAGRATLVHRPEDLALYDRMFAAFWEQRFGERVTVEGEPPQETLALDVDDEDEDHESDQGTEEDEDLQAVRFSRVEVLTEKDLGDCTDEELSELNELLLRLRFVTNPQRSRRLQRSKGAGPQPDLRRTIRLALKNHGEPVQRAFSEPSDKPRRLVLLLDVSGSMETYARAFLRFAHAATRVRNRVEVFAIGTRLTRVTRQLSSRDPDAALAAATPEVKDWSGGTRLGDTLAEFNNQWAIRGMARGAVVVILSDGWDRGDPEVLGEQMERLHRVTQRLIWVNPLKAGAGYAPIAAGMAAALPHVDQFLPGHSYNTLADLADLLAAEVRA